MTWEIVLHDAVDTWFLTLCKEDAESAALVAAAIDKLADDGPTLGRPLVDRIKASRHHNLKELRPGSTGASEIRILSRSTPYDKRSSSSQGTKPAAGDSGTPTTSRSPTSGSTNTWQT